MPHISFSELKNWDKCAYYHKLVHLDKLKGFEGNAHTAFGNAVHDVCEHILLTSSQDTEALKEMFENNFLNTLRKLPENIRLGLKEPKNKKLVMEMREQGRDLVCLVLDSVSEYFGEYETVSTEERLMQGIEEFKEAEYQFKGFIDLVVKTKDGKYHIIDWKTCSWGWDSRRKSAPMTTYQLTYYKHYFAKKHNIDPSNIETHFALLKRTAKKERIEFFRVTSGAKKTSNAINFLTKALHNINNKNFIKNRTACRDCEFYKTKHCG
jgi:ATP-dependent exoDNAse (exonuclease V) beta subunit